MEPGVTSSDMVFDTAARHTWISSPFHTSSKGGADLTALLAATSANLAVKLNER